MKIAGNRRWPRGLIVAMLLLTAGGCVGYGYGYGYGAGYDSDYYEPFGYDYGGWGPGYLVGPPPFVGYGGGFRGPHVGPHHGSGPHHGFRPAPPSARMPSIPGGHRGGGGGRGGHR